MSRSTMGMALDVRRARGCRVMGTRLPTAPYAAGLFGGYVIAHFDASRGAGGGLHLRGLTERARAATAEVTR